MRRRTTTAVGSAIAALVLVLAGCGGGDDETPETPAADTGTADDMATDEPTDDATDDSTDDSGDDSGDDGAAGEECAATVMVATTELGDVLVDADGMTLYMFDPDMQGASTCYDECAMNWPPLVAEGEPMAGAGADDAKLGTVERDDGTMQVTYDGWPLYLWAQDSAAGDTTGQGVNDVWWVLGADGEPIRD